MEEVHSIEHSGKGEAIHLRFLDEKGNSKSVGKKSG
jgi:hypothetical protein